MKIRSIFLPLFIAFLGLTGHAFALDENATVTLRGTEGSDSTFYGYNAGPSITSGIYNTFVGAQAGHETTSGSYNSMFGAGAGYYNDTGSSNCFFGNLAGHGNRNGGSYNVFLGNSAGYRNRSGDYNLFAGYHAGYDNDSGRQNVYLGCRAGYNNQTGSRNVYLGYYAGYNDDGSDHLFIANSGTSYPLIYGDFDTNSVIIHGAFRSIASYSSSDKRWKKNIRPLESSLDKVNMLKGVSYEWKTEAYPDMGLTEGQHIGLIAQDVESVFPELVSEDKDGYKAVSYTKLTAVLVEAVKALTNKHEENNNLIEEQSRLLDKQQAEYEKQQAEIEALRALLKDLKI